MRQASDRTNRIHLYSAVAAGAIAPQVTADIKVYSGPPIEVGGVTNLQLEDLEFDIYLSLDLEMDSWGNNGNPCCSWTSYGCKQYGGSADYYGWTYEGVVASRPWNADAPVIGASFLEPGAMVSSPSNVYSRVDGCRNDWRWWYYCGDGGESGTRSNCVWDQTVFHVGFRAMDPAGGPKDTVNGWIELEHDPEANNLVITRWAYEDDGGAIDVGEGYCEANATDLTYEYIESVQIEKVGFFNPSGSDGYTDYSALGAIELEAGGTYIMKVGNGDPKWANDALGVYVDWNADYRFTGPMEYLGKVQGVGPYFVQIGVPEDHPGGTVRMRLRLQDIAENPMEPCGIVLYGETEDYLIDIIPPTPCPGDIDDDGEVTAADLGLLIGAWGVCGDPADCAADLDGDGEVTAADLGLLIGAWGQCP
ncbi:MAG: hypothetical protein CMJ34_10235 [Phycisphaerae bacterium]|nr:hypothetical protein [Phycisphaerae bacterium]